ncbi:MAG: hypothetical protein KDJ64_02260 [Nitratireductor sp.]|nr:hypothetical protein [Nitratireductor sp.]
MEMPLNSIAGGVEISLVEDLLLLAKAYPRKLYNFAWPTLPDGRRIWRQAGCRVKARRLPLDPESGSDNSQDMAIFINTVPATRPVARQSE